MTRILFVGVVAMAALGAHRAAMLLLGFAVVVFAYRLLRRIVLAVMAASKTIAVYAVCIGLSLAIGLSRHATASPAPYTGAAVILAASVAAIFAAFLAGKMLREARSWRTA